MILSKKQTKGPRHHCTHIICHTIQEMIEYSIVGKCEWKEHDWNSRRHTLIVQSNCMKCNVLSHLSILIILQLIPYIVSQYTCNIAANHHSTQLNIFSHLQLKHHLTQYLSCSLQHHIALALNNISNVHYRHQFDILTATALSSHLHCLLLHHLLIVDLTQFELFPYHAQLHAAFPSHAALLYALSPRLDPLTAQQSTAHARLFMLQVRYQIILTLLLLTWIHSLQILLSTKYQLDNIGVMK